MITNKTRLLEILNDEFSNTRKSKTSREILTKSNLESIFLSSGVIGGLRLDGFDINLPRFRNNWKNWVVTESMQAELIELIIEDCMDTDLETSLNINQLRREE